MRREMIEEQIVKRGISDQHVIEAMLRVPRHKFIADDYQALAYTDGPLPIGYNQTISQPYIVALMTDLLELSPGDKVLEVGTGSGYQAAVLAEIVKKVYSIEVLQPLAQRANKKLIELGYTNVEVKVGNGYLGWPQAAPFDAIIVTCAPPEIPQALLDQLKIGGKMVVPVGVESQNLQLIIKEKDKTITKDIIPVRFVPMVDKPKDSL
jgi:protein-L-isoaspartate(D-aspartate) O-methyltransferase